MLARVCLLASVVAACGTPSARRPPSSPKTIGTRIPASCATTATSITEPRAILARTAAELTAEVACPDAGSLAEQLAVDFARHHVLVVTFAKGQSTMLTELDDDGTTLTVTALRLPPSGCRGIEYREHPVTLTVLVPAHPRAVRVVLQGGDPPPAKLDVPRCS